MQRLLEIAQLCFYLIGMLVMLWVGSDITTRLTRMDREMDRNAILHDQMLKDHLKGLKDLETSRAAHDQMLEEHRRQMERR